MAHHSDRFYTTAQAATFLCAAESTLSVWRHRKIGPRYHVAIVNPNSTHPRARRIRYALADLEAFRSQIISHANVIPHAYWGRPPGSKNRKGKALARSPLATQGGTVSPVERLPPSRGSAPGPGQKRRRQQSEKASQKPVQANPAPEGPEEPEKG